MMGRALPFSFQNVRVEEGKSVATHLPLLSPQPSALSLGTHTVEANLVELPTFLAY